MPGNQGHDQPRYALQAQQAANLFAFLKQTFSQMPLAVQVFG